MEFGVCLCSVHMYSHRPSPPRAESVLTEHVAAGRPYIELPQRVRERVSVAQWARRAVLLRARRADVFDDCPELRGVVDEHEFYGAVLHEQQAARALFPYHLAAPLLSRGVTPFSYYTDLLSAFMAKEGSYDQLPNILAADVVRVMGVGRNEYIGAMNSAKALKMQWRLQRRQAVAKQLPELPKKVALKNWWRVCTTSAAAARMLPKLADAAAAAREAGEDALRRAIEAEHELLQLLTHSAADHDGQGILADDLHAEASEAAVRLLRRGAAYVIVPVAPEDAFVVPPLEGFVSNKNTTAAGAEADRLSTEQLVYAVLLAASERAAVVELADLLDAPVESTQRALSVACRLGFAVPAAVEGRLSVGSVASNAAAAVAAPAAARSGGRCFALVLDNETVSCLMMNLSPGLMMHAVSLLEAGRLQADAARNLSAELDALPAADTFDVGLRESVECAGALRVALEALLVAGDVEVFRSDALQTQMGTTATAKLLSSFDAVVCSTGAPVPMLAVEGVSPPPALAAPAAVAAVGWAKLALFVTARAGPRALVLPRGMRLRCLPRALQGVESIAIVPWPSEGGNAGGGADGGGGSGGSTRKTAATSIVAGGTAAAVSALNAALRRHAVLAHVAPTGEVVHVALPLAGEGEATGDTQMASATAAARAWAEGTGAARMPGLLSAYRDPARDVWVPSALHLGLPLDVPSACALSAERLASSGLLDADALDMAGVHMRRLTRLVRALASFCCTALPGAAFDIAAFEAADPANAPWQADGAADGAASARRADEADADALPEMALEYDGETLRAWSSAERQEWQGLSLADELAALG